MNLETILKLLPKVGPIIAAAPEFKRLIEEIMATFGERDQAELQQAYEAAVTDAADAHADLQAIVARNS